jgi:hypothetical protein
MRCLVAVAAASAFAGSALGGLVGGVRGPALGNSGSGLHGFGGDFGFRGAFGKRVAGTVELTLSTGDTLVHEVSSANSFAGFWTLDASVTITGMTLEPFSGSTSIYYIGAHALFLGYAGVAIPAPGAIALLGAAGLIGATRRRG